ncbi:FG-GAP repeat domain-containing protein [Streptomyces sp. NPDC059534]|uniref:FG-GAP repeat domain-containing protein n=1 Tax=Streptomyces sp. NPDC059534 TaxID=3346859 RepID=UPI0036C6F639
MANSSGLNRAGVLSRVTVAAITAALVGTTTAAVAADAPQRSVTGAQQPASNASAFAASTAAVTPQNALYGVNSAGTIYGYTPNGQGGLNLPTGNSGTGWNYSQHINQVDQDGNGHSDGLFDVTGGVLYYTKWDNTPRRIGSGWGIYNKLVSVGSTGGAVADDLLARDSAGVLWHYLGYGTGSLTTRTKVSAGWGGYNQLAGKGDLTSDGKADMVARDGAGVLWLYKGTGNYKTPFTGRTKISAGWGGYNALVSVGDINYDGVTDLVARDGAGALWLYKGTGNASAPYYNRVKIGTGGWNGYKQLF